MPAEPGGILPGMSGRSRLWAGGLAALVLLLLPACGNAVEGLAENAVERAIENEVGGDADVQVDEDSVTIDTQDGSITAGSGSVPDDFPSDIALVEGEVSFAQRIETADGIGWSVQVAAADGDAAAVAEQVRADLTAAGFTVDDQAQLPSADGGATVLAERADLSAFVLVSSDGQSTTVIYTINETAAQ